MKNSSKQLVARGYVTAFIDLLGLSSSLAKFEDFHEGNKEQAIPILRQSIGRIVTLRKLLSSIYSEWEKYSPDDQRFSEISAGQFTMLSNVMTHNTVIRWFSDCCVISVPYQNGAVPQSIVGIYRLCYALSFATLVMLAHNQPIRGGLEIGYGIEVDGEVLGSSLTKAYDLEKRAKEPRIIVGQHLLGVLSDPIENLAPDNLKEFTRQIRERIWLMLSTPERDGTVFLHFLESSFVHIINLIPETASVIDAVIAHINEVMRNTEIDEKIRAKYEWLNQYFKANGYLSKSHI